MKTRKFFKSNLPYLFMALPGLIYLFINNYIPMYGIIMAFQKIDLSKGIFKGDFVGLQNFRFLFAAKDAAIITRNTVLYNLAFIVLNIFFGVFVAILLNELTNKTFLKFIQTSLLLPHLVSIIIITYIVYAFLGKSVGVLNRTVMPLLSREPVSWYTEPKYWPLIIIYVNTWKSLGFNSIVYYASVIGIDRTLYEAAEVDGAGKMKQITNITLPMLKPVVIMMLILSIGKILNSDFGLFYHVPMNSGILMPVTNVIDTYVYRGLMQLGDYSMSAAAGAYQSLVGFVLVLATNLIVRKISPDDALF